MLLTLKYALNSVCTEQDSGIDQKADLLEMKVNSTKYRKDHVDKNKF